MATSVGMIRGKTSIEEEANWACGCEHPTASDGCRTRGATRSVLRRRRLAQGMGTRHVARPPRAPVLHR